MSTTAASLPPYSAGIPPVITAADFTYRGSSGFANASVYSSVIGTPSTTYWICPWDPRTWMRPFWLGMKPGAESSIEDSCLLGVALGNWSMRLAPRSICEPVDDVSSSASAETLTVSFTPPSVNCSSTAIGTVECTSTTC